MSATEPAPAPEPLLLPARRRLPAGDGEIGQIVSARLSAGRYRHSIGVALIARALAERFGVDPDRAVQAGLLHDLAREEPRARLRELAAHDGYPLPPAAAPGQLAELHGPAGAQLARELLGIDDRELLHAIRHHTFGGPDLDPLAAALFIADKLEPRQRAWPPDLSVLTPALASLDHALLFAYDHVIRHGLDHAAVIDVRPVHARNRLLTRLGRLPAIVQT